MNSSSSSRDKVVSRCVEVAIDCWNKHIEEPLTIKECDSIEDVLNDALPRDAKVVPRIARMFPTTCEVNVIQRGLDVPSFLQPVVFRDER